MAIAKFTQVVSFFKTTLSQRLTDTATDVTLDAVPSGVIEYPTWAVIEPQGENKELIYLPSAPTSLTYASVVRGLNPSSNNDTDEGYKTDHPANVEVIIGPVHRHWNELVKVMDGTVGTGATIFRVGDETDSNVTFYAQNADSSKPYLQYNASQNKWLISNDGTSTYDIAAGGSGLSRGLGVNISASQINLDVRTSGGLRNNQGTGSQQADVDPTIVARLDTANTWTAAQSLTAARLLITTDAASGNEAVRKSLLDSTLTAALTTVRFGDSSDGAFAETSSTTTWNTATKTVYQFSSFSLTGTASLVIGSNLQNKPVIVLVDGDLTVTSSTVPAIDGRGRGGNGATGAASLSASNGTAGKGIMKVLATGGIGGSASTDPATFSGPGGGGGASCVTTGSDGGAGSGGTGRAAGTGGGTGLLANATSSSPLTVRQWMSILGCGDGGGAGCGSSFGGGNIAGGNGGAGGGCIIFFVKGNINITSTFNVSGSNGSNGTNSGSNYYSGGGGGGGGGSLGIFYGGSVTANTATFTVSGGTAGTSTGVSGNGGNGGSGIALVKQIDAKLFNAIFNG